VTLTDSLRLAASFEDDNYRDVTTTYHFSSLKIPLETHYHTRVMRRASLRIPVLSHLVNFCSPFACFLSHFCPTAQLILYHMHSPHHHGRREMYMLWEPGRTFLGLWPPRTSYVPPAGGVPYRVAICFSLRMLSAAVSMLLCPSHSLTRFFLFHFFDHFLAAYPQLD
jgi:hypothetical protein